MHRVTGSETVDSGIRWVNPLGVFFPLLLSVLHSLEYQCKFGGFYLSICAFLLFGELDMLRFPFSVYFLAL